MREPLNEDGAAVLQTQLAETMLASMWGLLLLRMRNMPRPEALELLNAIQSGAADLRFALRADGRDAQLDAAIAGPGSGDLWELMSTLFVRGPAIAPAPSVPSSAVDMLGAMHEALSASSLGSFVPADVRQWWLDAVRATVQKGGSFEQHAGLAGRGQAGLGRHLDLRNRDSALARALDAVAAEGVGVTMWDRCQRLAPLIKSFVKIDWPRTHGVTSAPADWPAWKVAVFDAARNAPGSTSRDAKLPTTARRLHQIVKSNPSFSFQKTGATVLAQYRKPEAM